MNPKVPRACSKCDHCHPEGKALRIRVRLLHISGNHSDHSLCIGCSESICPADLPQIWRRQCLLYGKSVKDNRESYRNAFRFAHDFPIGILGVYEV